MTSYNPAIVSPATRVLLVDDDAQLGGMLSRYLAAEGFEVETATDGRAAISRALSGEYAAIILDIMLPQLSGIEVLKLIRQKSRVPIIMLTARGDDVDRILGLELGADDYLPKPFHVRELIARLRAILRRATVTDPRGDETLSYGALTLTSAQRACAYAGSPLELTATEFNLLEFLLRAGATVSSKEELSRAALGRAHVSYDRSVDVHISRLRQKLETATSDKVQIETIRAIGYRLRHSP
jgi:two-component system, OmpR family, response regulator